MHQHLDSQRIKLLQKLIQFGAFKRLNLKNLAS